MHLKLSKLKHLLENLQSVVIAYSGGLDSTFLLKIALDTLGKDNVLAVTAKSETYPSRELKEALRTVKELGAPYTTIKTRELDVRNFKKNPINRCYYCKKELFKRLKKIAHDRGLKNVIDGSNKDDLKDVRFGMEAARELGVKSPLVEASIGKGYIRRLSRRMHLKTWSKPSFACLASRIPYYNKIDKKTLKKVDEAEDFLRRLNVKQVRVRACKDTARIEVKRADFGRVLKISERIVRRFKRLGFTYISLDLQGYRTGSMNEPYLLTKGVYLYKIALILRNKGAIWRGSSVWLEQSAHTRRVGGSNPLPATNARGFVLKRYFGMN